MALARGCGEAHPYGPARLTSGDSGTFTNNFDCAFPLEEPISGSIKDMLYLDVDGNPVKEILTAQFGGPVSVSWTNLATGKTLTSHQAAPLTRGQGLVFSAGPHQEQSGDTGAFCAALS